MPIFIFYKIEPAKVFGFEKTWCKKKEDLRPVASGRFELRIKLEFERMPFKLATNN